LSQHHIASRSELDMSLQQKAMQALIEIMSQDPRLDHKITMRNALSIAADFLNMSSGFMCRIEHDKYAIEVHISRNETQSAQSRFQAGLVNPVANSVIGIFKEQSGVIAIEDFQKSSSLVNMRDETDVFSACIGTRLTLNDACVGSIVFYDQAVRSTPFQAIDKEFVQMLGQWIQKSLHQHILDKQLINSQERITLALSGGNLGLWDLDLKTKNMVFNERWGQMLGYQLFELAQYGNVWRKFIHREDAKLALKAIRSHFEHQSSEIDYVARFKHKANHWVWIHSRGKIVERDIDGLPIRLMGTHQDISALKHAEEEVTQLAFYDVLTNLPNRRLLLDRLKHALINSARNRTNGALIFIDLDNFKLLNETLGHDTGDELLRNVASRLLTCLRDGDTVARFGGDEFVVMLDHLDTAIAVANHQVEKVGNKIIQSLNQPYLINSQQLFSSPTLGATFFNGAIDKIDDVLKRADIAMYQAKNAGKNCLRFFDQKIQSHLLNKSRLEEELRIGIEQQQFVLFYQPQIDRSGQITGAEALVRWQHPTRGLVSPLDFIPLAEETGLIIQIGCWVMETGCKQLVEWSKNPTTANYHLSINVSARQFQQPDFVERVVEKLHKTGANPNKLKLELTESMLVDDVDGVITKMSQLRVRGVSFSLDDFGTGFSSLSFLKLLPLNQLKIDKSFVRDVLTDNNDAVIARTIVALANSLGLSVIAEGVELEGQREFLAQNGCHDYQGYLFSRPLTKAQFNDFCKDYQPSRAMLQHDPFSDTFH
jgi:diguanylate cyclase (GGDEF)-like protein/PAS domain S-box-containing protein